MDSADGAKKTTTALKIKAELSHNNKALYWKEGSSCNQQLRNSVLTNLLTGKECFFFKLQTNLNKCTSI